MEKRIELLTTFMMMNGWATDEISIQQLFIRHALPHSLRCISDVLDAYGIRHQITHRKGRLPINATRNVALFVPAYSQPFLLFNQLKIKTESPLDEQDIYEIKISEGPGHRRPLESIIRHAVWKYSHGRIAGLILACMSLGALFSILYNRLPANYLTLGLVLLIGWGLSGLTVKKEFIQKEASKGLCHISGKDTCLELIRSKEAKLFGVMPLGILSFTYYSFLLFAFLMRPDNAMCVVIGYAALLTLPMIAYSVFWQTKYRKICPICIGIDLSLFFQLLLTLRFIRTSALLSEILVVALPLSLFFFASLQAFILQERHKVQSLFKDALRSKHENLLSRPEIFQFLIEQEPLLVNGDLDFTIKNKKEKAYEHHLIFVLNPHCEHCRKLIPAFEYLNNCRIDIIWASPTKESFILSSWLIKRYQETEKDAFQITIKHWREGEKPQTGWIPEKQAAHLATLHHSFVLEHGVLGTPYVLIDGKELPDIYDYNDLLYLL